MQFTTRRLETGYSGSQWSIKNLSGKRRIGLKVRKTGCRSDGETKGSCTDEQHSVGMIQSVTADHIRSEAVCTLRNGAQPLAVLSVIPRNW